MMRFPPPHEGTSPSLDQTGRRMSQPGSEFILPPPREDYGSTAEEVARQVGEHLAQWGELTEWAAETTRNQGEVIEDYGPQITDLIENRVMPWTVPTVAPLSQAINRRADPTFQLSDFMVPLMRGTSDSAGHSHTHNTTTEAYALQAGMDTKGRIYYAWITPAVTRAYDRLDFMVSEVVNPCPMDVAVYVLDNDTRTLHLQRLAQDVPIPLGETVATVSMEPWVAAQGSYICIAWLQRGSGNTRFVYGLDDTPRPLTNDVFPRKISATNQVLSQTSLPQQVDGSNGQVMDFEGYWFTPYAELSEAVKIPPRVFTESWPDLGGPIGRPWVALTSRGIGSFGGRTAASGVGNRVSIYETPLTTEYNYIQCSIYAPGSSGGNRRSTLVFRGTNDLRSGLGLQAIANSHYELIAWGNVDVTSSDEWDDRLVLESIPVVPATGHSIEIEFLNGQVTVWINGTAYVSDRTTSGYNTPGRRFLGIQNRRQAFITAEWSPWFGPWAARDLPQAGEDDDETEETR